MIREAWNHVTTKTIDNCWKHICKHFFIFHVCMSCIYYVFKYFDWIEIVQEKENDD